MKSQDLNSYQDSYQNIAPFLKELEPQGRILVLGTAFGEDLAWLSKNGHGVQAIEATVSVAQATQLLYPQVEVLSKNYLFLTLKEAEFTGVWANRTFNAFPAEQVQRMIATCFKGIKSGGSLGVIVDEGEGSFEDRGPDLTGPARTHYLYREKAICSMLDQTGFQIKKMGRQAANPSSGAVAKLLVIATRI